MSLKDISTAVCLTAMLTFGAAASARPTATIDIDSGPVRGSDDGAMKTYLGIPYAAPPVGELRWRPPQAPAHWSSTLEANTPGNACAQNGDLGAFASAGGREDCLYLNVYAPSNASSASAPKPVLVWIHGGNLTVGQANDYNPKMVVGRNMIVVTINYRLGVLGFFSNPDIDNEGHPFGNYGQMDQTFALDWVQRNIGKFGGDPHNVTIAGESSGGTSVLAQITSPWAQGKFQHAIVMSGAAEIIRHPYFGASRPVEYARNVGEKFADAAACKGQGAACLRKLPVEKILALQKDYIVNQTIIDGNFMPTHPGDALRTGKFNDVSIVNGTTRDEGTFFSALPENATGQAMSEERYQGTLKAFFGDKLASSVAKEYPSSNYETPSEAFAAVATDYLFSCPALQIDNWASKKTTVHAYEFADRTAPSYIPPTTFPLGAAHTSELAYVFEGFHGGNLGVAQPLNAYQKKLSDEMVRYWTTSNDTSNWTTWPKFESAHPQILQLTLPADRVINGAHYAKFHHCGFWNATGVF
ncbi:carboxylesterase/lipase family protein [Paraburkholderia sp. HD33-4]|uniref:carboxylesterase/lipase family protein n=1 Tax=Paraburkholderia sp. HD33-4 TaxID=2883242 RepID=UPI001F29F3BB|nr:carboxylesterase family protein [Paraburkholderia sp. HD33-4]